MAVRDGEAFLADALESVVAQTFEDLEAIVVDDGSTDRTPEILDDYARRDGRLRVMRVPGNGVARARNLGCNAAQGRYLAILDSDDVALPERLNIQVPFLDARPDVAVVGGAGIFIDEQGVEIGRAAYPSDEAEVEAVLESGRVPLIHSAATVRAEIFHRTSGYRPALELAQDYDLWLRIAPLGRITSPPDPVVRYRIHARQASTRNFEKTARSARAALAAARARRKGESDPLDDAESVDGMLLEALGVGTPEIAAHEIDYALWLARTLARGGHHDQAGPLFSLCVARAGDTENPRETRIRILRARAEASYLQRRPLHAAGFRLRAAALERRGQW